MPASEQQRRAGVSKNKRVLQVAKLLLLLKPWDKVKDVPSVQMVFYNKVCPSNDPILFSWVLRVCEENKILLPRDPSNPQRLQIDPARAQQFINTVRAENLSNSLLGSSAATPNKIPPEKWSPVADQTLSTPLSGVCLAAITDASPKKPLVEDVDQNVDLLADFMSSLSLSDTCPAVPSSSEGAYQPSGLSVSGHPTNQCNNLSMESPWSMRQSGMPMRPGVVTFVDQNHCFKSTLTTVIQKTDNQTKEEDGRIPCKACRAQLDLEEVARHRESDEHIFFERYNEIRKYQQYQINKVPRELTGEFEHITIQSADLKEGHAVLTINLILPQEDKLARKSVTTVVDLLITYDPPPGRILRHFYLDSIFLVAGPAENIVLPTHPRKTISRGKPVKRLVEISENSVKLEEYVIIFKFIPEREMSIPGEPIFVMKQINVRVDNESTREDGEPAKGVPSASPDQNQPTQSSKFELIDEAEKPPRPKRLLKFVRVLKDYYLSSIHQRLINSGLELSANVSPDMLHALLDALNILAGDVNPASYQQFMKWMLYLEEHQLMCDLKAYSMKNAPILTCPFSRNLVSIGVPGLAENRPSVLKGDAIFVTLNGKETYKGLVHRVGLDRIHVSLGSTFMRKFVNNMKATIDFSFTRVCVRMEHRALEILQTSNLVSKICFPEAFGCFKKQKTVTNWINKLIGGNPEQARAVQNILNGSSRPAPYLVFGPPGTGKTVTVVEAIKQIYFDKAQQHFILATAPSNAAADLLAERILESVPRSDLIRLYSPSREWSKVPEVLRSCCNYYDLGNMKECCFPALDALLKFRIIVCTLICAGRLVSGDCPVSHFTHIFVDECGHGMETTALVPVAGLLSSNPPGQLVLSGDPCQLGPIIRSPVAKKLGFGQSLLERLMNECPIYKKMDRGYNSDVLTKLVRNFRSHPAILEVPNKLFYDGELQSCGEEGITHSICNWEELPNPNFPIIFHGVEGKDQQDDNSPSFYNIAEVDVVVQYVQKIMNAKFRGQKLKSSDVGIVSPYRKQIEKLHRALERKNCLHLSVGSAEEFQGQERRVIIVSTVRSDPARVALDNHFHLGFLCEPKRFNVAMTRAKALLIVVGNPNTLQHDPNWHSILEHAVHANAYVGCKFTLKSLDYAERMRSLDELRKSQQDHFDSVRQQVKMEIEKLRKETLQLSLKPENVYTMLENIRSTLFSVPPSFQTEYMEVDDDYDAVSAMELYVSPPFYHQEE